MTDLEGRIEITGANLKLLDKKLGDIQKKRKKAQVELETHRLKEREIADKIEEDAKELEKMASKQTVFQVSKKILTSFVFADFLSIFLYRLKLRIVPRKSGNWVPCQPMPLASTKTCHKNNCSSNSKKPTPN